jgi:iron complex outermembrane receptor protein
MKKYQPARTSSALWRATPVAAAVAAVLASGGVVHAQQAAPAASDTGSVVTITGIRRGIESAITVKKANDGVVEAISAEDVGKLPDNTVADAISRLPGLATQRNRSTGRSQNVSVRGLSPDFNAATLNGREQASTGDSRGVEFDQFPAELLSGVDVYKTPKASLINQGLASTIDLKTVRPLDFGKRVIQASLRKEKTGIDSGAGEGDGDRVTLSYIDQFADRKLGIALGFTQLKDKGAEQQKFNAWGGWAPDVTGCTSTYDAGGACTGTTVTGRAPGGFTADTERTTFERSGVMGVIQFKPNKNFDSTLDYFYSEGDFSISKKGLEGAVGGNSAGGYDPNGRYYNVAVDGSGNMTRGTLDNYKGVVRNHDERVEDDLTALGWANRIKFGEWTALVDLSQSKVNRKGTRYETTAGLVGNGNLPAFAAAHRASTISWSGFTGGNFDQVRYSTSLNYADPAVMKLTDPMGWSGGESSPQAGYVALPTIVDEIKAVRASAKRAVNFGPIIELDFGANISDRSKTRTAAEGRLVIKGSVTASGTVLDPYAAVNVPSPGVGTAGTTGLPIITWNPQGSLGTIYELPPKVDRDILNKDWDVTEKVNTFYAQGGIDTELFGRGLRGNVGMQFVQTDQTGSGFVVNPATCVGNTPATCPSTRISIGHKYDDVLPSLNLALDLPADSVVRLGLAKVMSRASMADMRASSTFGVNATAAGGPRIEGSGGNPFLEPFRSTQIDLSFEKYFGGNKGYVSLAAFHKDLRTYVYRQTQAVDFSRYGVALPPGLNPVGLYTQPANGTGGRLSGTELTVSVPFGIFVKALDGFGVQVNHSTTSSSVTIPTSGLSTQDIGAASTVPLPGLSKNVTNTRVYFEKWGFQVAWAQRKRSAFLGEVSDFQDNRQLTFVAPETTEDLQLSYEIQSGFLKGLSFNGQIRNLTNAEFKRYTNTPDNIVERVKYGKTYTLGLNYKL